MSNDISGSGTRYMVRWTYVYRRHTQPPVIRYNWEEMFVKLRQAINGRVLHIAVTLCSIYIYIRPNGWLVSLALAGQRPETQSLYICVTCVWLAKL